MVEVFDAALPPAALPTERRVLGVIAALSPAALLTERAVLRLAHHPAPAAARSPSQPASQPVCVMSLTGLVVTYDAGIQQQGARSAHEPGYTHLRRLPVRP